MSHFRFAVTLSIAVAIAASFICALGAVTATAQVSRAVSLSDATYAPSFLRLVPARSELTHRQYPCKGKHYFGDVSAYRWNGRALGAQQRDIDNLLYWSAPSGRAVGYDGRTFYNGLRVPVLVAGWCN
jgi:hypothetical protein